MNTINKSDAHVLSASDVYVLRAAVHQGLIESPDHRSPWSTGPWKTTRSLMARRYLEPSGEKAKWLQITDLGRSALQEHLLCEVPVANTAGERRALTLSRRRLVERLWGPTEDFGSDGRLHRVRDVRAEGLLRRVPAVVLERGPRPSEAEKVERAAELAWRLAELDPELYENPWDVLTGLLDDGRDVRFVEEGLNPGRARILFGAPSKPIEPLPGSLDFAAIRARHGEAMMSEAVRIQAYAYRPTSWVRHVTLLDEQRIEDNDMSCANACARVVEWACRETWTRAFFTKVVHAIIIPARLVESEIGREDVAKMAEDVNVDTHIMKARLRVLRAFPVDALPAGYDCVVYAQAERDPAECA